MYTFVCYTDRERETPQNYIKDPFTTAFTFVIKVPHPIKVRILHHGFEQFIKLNKGQETKHQKRKRRKVTASKLLILIIES